jgi:hypothetical protein
LALDVPTGPDPVDVVVLVRSTADEIEQACGVLRSKGWIYVEAEGPFRARAGHMGTPGVYRCARILARLGFDEVEMYWHLPSFRSCVEIVGLLDRPALLHSLRRRRRTVVARAQVAVAVLL